MGLNSNIETKSCNIAKQRYFRANQTFILINKINNFTTKTHNFHVKELRLSENL